jgi:hypothetical protein
LVQLQKLGLVDTIEQARPRRRSSEDVADAATAMVRPDKPAIPPKKTDFYTLSHEAVCGRTVGGGTLPVHTALWVSVYGAQKRPEIRGSVCDGNSSQPYRW